MANDNNGWISCDKQLPLAHKRVLITTMNGYVVEARRIKENGFIRLGQPVTATHWQELPEPAKQ